ncbi:MAG: endolytic transglycosylase MltG, partial [Bacteroidales bacterium]
RGDGSMSDVIFSGSKSRNPLNVASVTLVFDNSDHYLPLDYSEISIKRILYKHLTIDSPYNTYKIVGLPPGPITLPSQPIIDAVLNYSQHDYLYFCANSTLDGSHNFSKTLAEHNRNARAYQAAISRLK